MNRVNLPHDDNSCGWYSVLPPAQPATQLIGKQNADYAIIGAGFSGMAAARRLAQLKPEARILLVDAQRVAEGASGRNSGFVIDLPHKFSLEHPDDQLKQTLLTLNRIAISQLQHLIVDHEIDCQWTAAGKYQGAVTERGEKHLDHFEQLMKRLGEPYRWVDKAELNQVLGTEYYSHAIYTPGSYLMQPAALMRGMAQNLPQNVELLEQSPIQNIRQINGKWVLTSNKGTIMTPTLLLGTSIFTKEFGYLKHRLLPVMTFASWTRPLTDAEMQTYQGKLNWGLTPADYAGTTLRMTKDRRILIRNTYEHVPRYGKSIDQQTRQWVHAQHQKAFVARYPQLAAVPLTHTWGGMYAISRNFTNYFGQLEDGLYASACDNGVGVAWGTVSGTLLADLAVGVDSQHLEDIKHVTGMPSLNPPEPFLGMGVKFRIQLAKWQSRREL